MYILRRCLPRPIKHLLRKLWARPAASPPPFIVPAPEAEMLEIWQGQLQRIVANHQAARGVIVYPPTIEWGIHLFQRPHQLARIFSSLGYLYFFCSTYPHTWDPMGFKRIADNLYLCTASLEVFKQLRRPAVWIGRGDLERYLVNFTDPFVIYDFIDDLEVFAVCGPALYTGHDRLLETADLCIATATKLVEEIKPRRPDTIFSPNAGDYDFFKIARYKDRLACPEDMKPIIQSGKPVIGYYGSLAEWVDYEMIRYAAQQRPNWHLVLVGFDYDGSFKTSNLASLPNVSYLGSKEYQTLNGYLAYFDVATIPFKINTITLATSPVKLFEYMAGCKPIVSTGLTECRLYPGVLIAEGKEDFVAKVEQALQLRDDEPYLQLLDKTAFENSWEVRARQIIAEFDSRGFGLQKG
jgi:hypothetical protein